MRSDVRETLRKVERLGWVQFAVNGESHLELVHPDTDKILTLPTTPSDVNWVRNFLTSAHEFIGLPSPYGQAKRDAQAIKARRDGERQADKEAQIRSLHAYRKRVVDLDAAALTREHMIAEDNNRRFYEDLMRAPGR